MRRSTRLVLAIAACAILAVTMAQAVTQLYVQAPLKYRGHWVFNTATGASVSIVVQNVSAAQQNFKVDFAGQQPGDSPTSPLPPVAYSFFASLAPSQTRQFDFTLPTQVTSLNFIRIIKAP